MRQLTTPIAVLCLFLVSLTAIAQDAATTNAVPGTNAVPVPPPKKKTWEGSIALGLTITRGNSKTTLFSGTALADKKWDKNELDLGADGVYGDDHGVKNAQSVHGFAQYNRMFTERAYGYLRFDGLHDAIANIDYRFTISGGPGYYFIKNTNTTLRGEIGPGYVYEQDATTNGPVHHSYMTLRIAERFEQKLSEHAKLWEGVEYLPQVDRWGNYIINGEIGVESSMTKTLSLQVVLVDNYHSEPPPGRLKNDLKLIAGVKYTF
jgi:putative salt-induced outer membrane protein YdiY